jgi:hypothetical protein
MRRAFLMAGLCTAVSMVVAACMSRPVATTEPHTSNLYVEPIRNDVIDKIDLLFMIDNSRSMGDKQKLLAKAVPQLVERLVIPRCVNDSGEVRRRTAFDEACPAGFAPEFRAVNDIHIAVITSSLGAHGAANAQCQATSPGDDHARLLPSVRTGLVSYNNSGFLAWDPLQKLVPAGEKDPTKLGQEFGGMVQKAGEDGCGYEASLESWYRFLIDPEPPLTVTSDTGRSVASGVDAELLAQRKAFLRPDSLVSIVMLTDENDCSIIDEEFGHYIANGGKDFMPRGTAACEKDPNDRCCLPCTLEGAVPDGCTPIASDAACMRGRTLDSDAGEDSTNLRCLQNKRRFGYDFLYPTSRYVDALTQLQVRRRSDGQLVENPLFATVPGVARRTKDLVYLAGIVGVPWQDIADDASQAGPGLRYLTASELSSKGRWDVIVGDSSKNVAPSDPFMRESEAPRSGTNPVIGVAITPETAMDPRANPINGHEQANQGGGDLQYACTFPLQDPAPCTSDACDCENAATDKRNRPLCQPPGGGAAGTTQYFGKAYPGLRPLEVLKGLGDSAIVASICPKILTDGEPGYGYEPAVDAIVDRLKTALAGRCPPRPLAVEPGDDGKLPCVVVEALEAPDACGCTAAGRKPASAAASRLVEKQLRDTQSCDTSTSPACSKFCFCELAQAEGDNRTHCLNETTNSDTPGYCYVDPFGEPPVGNPELVKDCNVTSKRLIRFVGPNTPTPGATAYIACLGATLH